MLDDAQRVAAWIKAHDSEEGQTLVEYALIIALVSIALIGALQALTGAWMAYSARSRRP